MKLGLIARILRKRAALRHHEQWTRDELAAHQAAAATALREHAFELDPRHVTKDLARALSDIGVTRASLGVQDLSAHVQQAIGRVQPFAVVERAADILRESGITDLNIDLMYGLPNQSMHDVRRTVLFVHQLKPQRLAVFGYAHIPWIKRHQRLLDESALPRSAARFDQAIAAHAALTSFSAAALSVIESPRVTITFEFAGANT